MAIHTCICLTNLQTAEAVYINQDAIVSIAQHPGDSDWPAQRCSIIKTQNAMYYVSEEAKEIAALVFSSHQELNPALVPAYGVLT
jgi:hypothetical protein